MNIVRKFTEEKIEKVKMTKYFETELMHAEFGGLIYDTSSIKGTEITIKVGRMGYAIGKRGKVIRKMTADLRQMAGREELNLEVEQLKNPELNANVMAAKLAISLMRGRHFRRTAYGTVRRIMSKGALGVEIIVAGKITSQRSRVEKFRDGFLAKTGDPKRKFLSIGQAIAKIKRGILGVTVLIMMPDARLPDQMTITAEPTHTSKEITISDGTSVGEILDSEGKIAEVEEDGDKFDKELAEAEFEELTFPESASKIIGEDKTDSVTIDDEPETISKQASKTKKDSKPEKADELKTSTQQAKKPFRKKATDTQSEKQMSSETSDTQSEKQTKSEASDAHEDAPQKNKPVAETDTKPEKQMSSEASDAQLNEDAPQKNKPVAKTDTKPEKQMRSEASDAHEDAPQKNKPVAETDTKPANTNSEK